MIDSATERRLRKLPDTELEERAARISETLTLEAFGRGDEEARIELMQERSMLLREQKRRKA